MSTLKQNLLVGTDEAVITPANSASGGDAFSSVVGSPVYDTAEHMHGAASARLAAGTAQQYVALKPATVTTQLAARVYAKFTALPTAHQQNLLTIWSAGSDLNGVNIGTDGRVNILTPTGTSYYVTPSGQSVKLNTWYRFDVAWTIDPSAGSMNVRVYEGTAADTTTALWSLNPTAINTGSTKPDEVRFGSLANSSSIGQQWLDEPAVADGTALLIGPYVPPAPTVAARATVVNQSVTLSAGWTTYDGAAPTFAWTQTAGPAVTLSSSTAASPTASAMPAGTYTFAVTATDSAGQTAADSVTFAIAAPSSAPTTPPPTDQGNPNPVVSMYQAVFVIDASKSQPVNGGSLSYAITPHAGLTDLAPGIWAGLIPDAATAFGVTITEASTLGTHTASTTVTVPAKAVAGTPQSTIVVLVASDDAALGGVFQ